MKQRQSTNPFGKLVKNTEGCPAFVPGNLPPTINYDESLTALISGASSRLGNLSSDKINN